MSFINLMGQTVFTPAQIDHRVVAMIRSRYSQDDEQFYSRILHGAALGTYIPTTDEMIEVQTYQQHVEACREVGRAARVDNALLQRVLDYERAQQRLARYRLADGSDLVDPLPATIEIPVFDEGGEQIGTEIIPNPWIVADDAERDAAQVIVDAATVEILTLAQARMGDE